MLDVYNVATVRRCWLSQVFKLLHLPGSMYSSLFYTRGSNKV